MSFTVRLAGVVLAALAAAAEAPAQTCTTGPRVPFAGHSFPLVGVPNPTTLTPTLLYPNLTLDHSLGIAWPPDGSGRAVVVEQPGRLRLLPTAPNANSAAVYLDLSADVVFTDGGEQGLLGLAFDPNFSVNHYLYVNYTSSGSRCIAGPFCTKIVRYTQRATNPSQVDPASRLPILEWAIPQDHHNAGALAFGQDGMLYIASGDGGPIQGQDRSTLLAAILRIDVHGGSPYRIPPDNPFVGQAGIRGEIFAWGLRNPWRISFDRLTGDLWIGDVGAGAWEEVDFIAAGDRSGPNFGWHYCEGRNHDANGHVCSSIVSKPPVFDYPHNNTSMGGYSVTGGYLYRGDRLTGFYGAYLYADFVGGSVWAYSPASGVSTVLASLYGLSAFGEDPNGELVLVTLTGRLYTLQPTTGGGGQQFPSALSATRLFSNTAALTPAAGMIGYGVNSPLWSDGALKQRWLALPTTSKLDFSADAAWTFPVGTALVKHFDLPTGPTARRRLETRVLLRQTDRWVGYTYKWNAAGTDATLLTDALDETVTADYGAGPVQQTWHYPSPSECLGCHAQASGRVLGVRTAQLNRNFAFANGTDNQLHAWGSCLGLFKRPIEAPAVYASYADPANTAETTNARARSYLAANCAHCHQPGGIAPGGLDLRYEPLLGGMNAIGVVPSYGNLGVSGAQRVRVGSSAQSVLWLRVQSTDPLVRMARGTRVPDPLAVSLLRTWIDTGLATLDSDGDGRADSSDNCPYEPNPSQADTGSWLSPAANAIGDACQCENADAIGQVNAADLTALRRSLAGIAGAAQPGLGRRASYVDAEGRASAVDAAHLDRALTGAEAPPAQICPAATRLSP